MQSFGSPEELVIAADDATFCCCRLELERYDARLWGKRDDVNGLPALAIDVLANDRNHAVVNVRGQVELAAILLCFPVLVWSTLDHVLAAARQRDVDVGGKRLTALDQVIALHPKDAVLRERHRLTKHGAVGEVKNEATFDVGITRDLHEITVREEGAGL